MPKILVVDDDKNLRFLYQRVLSKAGYDVITVPTKEAALEKLPEVDLVISELDRPAASNGTHLDHFYKSNRRLKVIVNTAYPLKYALTLRYRADATMEKTSDVDKLTMLVDHILNNQPEFATI